MKKQLLLLVVAIFAIGFTSVYGQTAFDPPTCSATPLSPAAGEQYNYAATITNVAGSYDGLGLFKWYVTKDVNLLTGAVVANGGGEIIASGHYNTNTNPPTGDDINITWTSAALATGVPYYLVVRYEEPNESGGSTCTAMNMKVYRIVPQNTFWLRMESVADAAGAAGGVYQCAADISGATVTEPAGTVEYTYGQNVLYVKISASGYTGDWTPTLRISGAMDDQSIGAAGITWTSGVASGVFTGGGAFGNGNYTSNNPMPSTMGVFPGTGTEIIVTIPINNNHHQALLDQTIAVAIDGSYLGGAITYNDKSDVNGNCTDATPFEDTVNKIIKARPGVNPVAPNTFVPDPLTKP
ncbi:MAG: hypothetical protein ACOYNC_00310 [Bacteroidales bacterium]